MNIIWLQVSSLIYILLINTVFFIKKRLDTLENTLFKILMVSNIFGLLIELGCFYSVSRVEEVPIFNFIITRALLIYYLLFITIFTIYLFVICFNRTDDNEKEFKKYTKKICNIFTIFFLLNTIIVWFLPLNYHYDGVTIYSYGPAVNCLNIVYVLLIILWVIILTKNAKYLKNKKYLPVFAFIFLSTIIGIIQRIYPWLLLTTPLDTYIIFLMFFTIENPDMKMIEELNKTRKINDKANEDKANFLFKITQDIREPVSDINYIIDNISTNNIKVDEGLAIVKDKARSLSSIINEALDVSSIEAKTFGITNRKYNITNLLDRIVLRKKKEISNNIEFRVNISKSIPSILYGDEIRIKQIINSIINNSIKYTNRGFIEFDVESIIKYDSCRLIITISDSGIGMDVKDINSLLVANKELDEEALSKVNDKELNILTIKKMVHLIGGSFNIRSELGEGTTVTIAIDQKIIPEEKDEEQKVINSIEKKAFNKKKIVLVSKNDKVKKKFSKIIGKTKLVLKVIDSSKECLDRIRDNQTADLIFIQEDMDKIDAHELLLKLKKEKNNQIPIILITKNNDSFDKDKYLQEGFVKSIDYEIDTKEIKEILENL